VELELPIAPHFARAEQRFVAREGFFDRCGGIGLVAEVEVDAVGLQARREASTSAAIARCGQALCHRDRGEAPTW